MYKNNLKNQNNRLNEGELSYKVLREGEDNENVLVLFPGGIGTLTQFQNLISVINEDNSFNKTIVGMELIDRAGFLHDDPAKLIYEMGEQYGKILAKKEFKTYQMAGYCFGGLVAIEAARYMKKHNKNVEMVFTIDTLPNETFLDSDLLMERSFTLFLGVKASAVGHTIDDERLKEALEYIVKHTGGRVTTKDLCSLGDEYSDVAECYKKLADKTHEERIKEMINCVHTSIGKVSEDELQAVDMLYQIFYHTSEAVWEYIPRKYYGEVTILSCKDTSTSFMPSMKTTTKKYIENMVVGKTKVKEIEGNHGTCVIQPFVSSLAKAIIKSNGTN